MDTQQSTKTFEIYIGVSSSPEEAVIKESDWYVPSASFNEWLKLHWSDVFHFNQVDETYVGMVARMFNMANVKKHLIRDDFIQVFTIERKRRLGISLGQFGGPAGQVYVWARVVGGPYVCQIKVSKKSASSEVECYNIAGNKILKVLVLERMFGGDVKHYVQRQLQRTSTISSPTPVKLIWLETPSYGSRTIHDDDIICEGGAVTSPRSSVVLPVRDEAPASSSSSDSLEARRVLRRPAAAQTGWLPKRRRTKGPM